MTFHPKSWRKKNQMTHKKAGIAIGLTERGWQDVEKLWDKETIGNTKKRTELACYMSDILRCKSRRSAGYMAQLLWSIHNEDNT